MRELRFDTFRLDKAEQIGSGGLRIAAYPTRAGVLTYRRSDGSTVRELRHPSEVFKPESLATLAGVPLTDLHPAEGAVTPANWSAEAVGHVGDMVKPADDGTHVAAHVYVSRGDAVKAVLDKSRGELSCGYHADVDEQPGVYNGEKYDRIQRNISYNHLAILPPGGGRAGSTCALRLDAAYEVQEDPSPNIPIPQAVIVDQPTRMLKVDGKDLDPATPECQAAITALEGSREKTRGELAAEKARADGLAVKLAEVPKTIGKLVRERVQLLSNVRKAHAKAGITLDADEEAAAEGADDPVSVMTDAIKKWNASLDIEGKSPDYIQGVFAAMMADLLGDKDEGEAEETPTDALPPPKNSPPEMELNGLQKLANGKASLGARRGGLRHDNKGYVAGAGAQEMDPEDAQMAHNKTLASLPLASHVKA